MTVRPIDHIGVIAAEISKAFQTVVAHDMTRRDAQAAASDASQAATNVREAALITLAGISHRDKWSKLDTDEAVLRALSTRNNKDASLATLASEIKRACQPGVRQHVPALAKLAGDVWEAELAEKGAKPCRKAFQRKYHMLGRMFTEASNGRVFTAAPDVIRWAVALDPDLDYAKVFKRLKAIREQLNAFAADFPVDGFDAALEFLGAVTPDDLKASREQASEPGGTEAAAVAPSEAAEAGPEPAEGAVSLEDMINDASEQKAA